MTIWVVGGKGMLGKAVLGRLAQCEATVVSTDLDVDISDLAAVEEFAARHRPNAIINCAAYTAVDAAEQDEAKAHRVNGLGPSNLAVVCKKTAASMVHISTDYVFPGDGTTPYTELDVVGPKNAYGRTKLSGEQGIASVFQDANESRWVVFRTSWLFGDGGSSFVDTMWRLMLDKPELRVVADQVGRPTYVEDLAKLAVAYALSEPALRLPDGIWHFANSGSTSWHAFAVAIREAMLRMGAKVRTERIVPVTSAEFPRPASRPHFSVLDTAKLEAHGYMPRPWAEALDEYVRERWSRENRG